MDKREINIKHVNLAAGAWQQMSVCEQMANIGSEVSRALNWQKKEKKQFCSNAVARALELIDLSMDLSRTFPRIKEFARLREAIIDYFYGLNQFSSSEVLWRKYFDHFNYAVRRNY